MTVIHDQISATESYFSSLEKMLIFHFLFQSFSIKIYLILKEKCLQPTKISLTRSRVRVIIPRDPERMRKALIIQTFPWIQKILKKDTLKNVRN